jgi:hypothetical protein
MPRRWRVHISTKVSPDFQNTINELELLTRALTELKLVDTASVEFTIHCVPEFSTSQYFIDGKVLRNAIKCADTICFSHTLVDLENIK